MTLSTTRRRYTALYRIGIYLLNAYKTFFFINIPKSDHKTVHPVVRTNARHTRVIIYYSNIIINWTRRRYIGPVAGEICRRRSCACTYI